jgi:glycerol uptake facilitator-like aquaporin
MTPAGETYLGLLVMTVFWAIFSGACVVACVHERQHSASWIWASSFGTASLVAAYCFGRLL